MSRWIGGDSKPNGNDRFTKVLLHFDGDAVDSNAGGSAHTWSALSSASASATPKFGSAAAGFNNLAGSANVCWTTPEHADFDLGISDFTIDFWFALDTGTIGCSLAGQRGASSNFAWFMTTALNDGSGAASLAAAVYKSGVQTAISGTFTGALNAYNHAALVRSGNSLLLFINGVLLNTASFSGAVDASTSNLSVGRAGEAAVGNGFSGSIDEFRLSVGIARWTTNFTPPTRAYSQFLGSGS